MRPVLEPWAGGRLHERGADGARLHGSVVTWIVPETSIDLAGTIAPPWSGPATTPLHPALEEKGGGASTARVARDDLFGRLDDRLLGSLESGWKRLFGEGLKRHAEGLRGVRATTRARPSAKPGGRRGRPRRTR